MSGTFMLADGSQTLNEISFLLGFADLSAFFRAFKRWTGMAPSAYIESMGSRSTVP